MGIRLLLAGALVMMSLVVTTRGDSHSLLDLGWPKRQVVFKFADEVSAEFTQDRYRSVPMVFDDGSQYTCHIPKPDTTTHADEEQKATAAAKTPAEPPTVAELTAMLGSVGCLTHMLGTGSWWSYELCQGKWVRQFHADPQTNAVQTEYYLGRIPPQQSLSFSPATKTTAPKVSETYRGGTTCDLTGEARMIEVVYYCSEGIPGGGMLMSVQEVATCQYKALVHTSLLCKHRAFKEDISTKKKDVPKIVCLTERPVGVTSDQCSEASGGRLCENNAATSDKPSSSPSPTTASTIKHHTTVQEDGTKVITLNLNDQSIQEALKIVQEQLQKELNKMNSEQSAKEASDDNDADTAKKPKKEL